MEEKLWVNTERIPLVTSFLEKECTSGGKKFYSLGMETPLHEIKGEGHFELSIERKIPDGIAVTPLSNLFAETSALFFSGGGRNFGYDNCTLIQYKKEIGNGEVVEQISLHATERKEYSDEEFLFTI